jgi:hypothetical protein
MQSRFTVRHWLLVSLVAWGIASCDASPGLNVSSAALPLVHASARLLSSDAFPASCCMVCSKGKACGNSCISRSKQCHQPPGCACDE